MRPIKFKAKTSDGEWVEGLYSTSTDKGETTHYIGDFNLATPIDPNTLCQFTGKPDKNRKGIYEGDIFRYSGLLYVVEWLRYGFRFKMLDELDSNKSWYLDDVDVSECEVIGNIHDK